MRRGGKRAGSARAEPVAAGWGEVSHLKVFECDQRVELRIDCLHDVWRGDAAALHGRERTLHPQLLLHRVADLHPLLHHEQLFVAFVAGLHSRHEVGRSTGAHAPVARVRA
jgi:hypothetical protein